MGVNTRQFKFKKTTAQKIAQKHFVSFHLQSSTPKGEVEGDLAGGVSPGPHPGGGSPGPHPGGLQAHTWEVVYPSMH